jgi:thioredoxin reductase (NADPH)
MAEHDLQSVAFPTLDDAQIARLSGCTAAVPRSFTDGQTLFAVGDRNPKFFVVKAGEIEIVDSSGDAPRRVTVHRKGEFTGDVSHLTGAPAVVSAVARGPCAVIEVPGEALRRVLNQCPELSDLILQAFIARRQLLRQSPDFTGLRVIGSRYSTHTFRVRDFLAKNRVLFTWVDLETDPQVDRLLRQFGVTEADTPVVACGHRLMLRNPSNRQLADAVGIRQPLEQAVYDRGAAHGAAGADRARRAGGQQHAHRELPRFPHRPDRQRAGQPRGAPGQQVRRPPVGANSGDAPGV